jgi:putative membrane protein
MYYYNSFFPFQIIGAIFTALFWLFIIYIIFSVVRRMPHDGHHNNRAMEILKERYAKGEITKEQFEQMKKDLQ